MASRGRGGRTSQLTKPSVIFGMFESADEAARAYDRGAGELFGEDAATHEDPGLVEPKPGH